jgi:hypothetical protein
LTRQDRGTDDAIGCNGPVSTSDGSQPKMTIYGPTSNDSSNDFLYVVDRDGDTATDTEPNFKAKERPDQDESDSEVDTADKLSSFRPKPNATARAPAQPCIASAHRFCDATESSDSDASEAAEEESGLEVSFYANGKSVATTKSKSFGPTGLARQRCLDALGQLRNKLRKAGFTRSVQLIGKARVPIIKIETIMGFEADVAIGGHNGVDTSHVAKELMLKYKRYD